MKTGLFLRGIAALSVCLAVPSFAQDLPAARPEQVGLSAERLTRLDQQVEADIKAGRIPGAVVLLVRHGRVAHYSAFGMADGATGRAMRRDDIFRIYSMTKPVVSVALLMLLEEGKFQLSDPLEKYIPAFRGIQVYAGTDANGAMVLEDAKRAPTIQDAMRHTAGFANAGVRTPVDRRYLELGISFTTLESLEQEMRLLGQAPLAYQPGENWLYGKNHDVQAYLVQQLSGMPLDRFLQERLFGPLGMKDTAYRLPDAKAGRTAEYGNAIAWPDPENPGLDMRPETYRRFATRPFGTMGLWSTAMDYARFAQMLLNGGELDGVRILSRKSVELMTMNQLPPAIGDLTRTGRAGSGYGLGVSVAVDPARIGNLISPGTFGWPGAATTTFLVDPQEGMVAIYMAQQWPYDARALSEFQTLAYQAIAD